MIKRIILVSVISAVLSAYASPYITNVVAKQRYPWNGKVDISFEVVGDPTVALPEGKVAGLSIEMKDKTTGKEYGAANLTGDIEPTEGIHNVVWDMLAQGISVYVTNAVFSVSYLVGDPLYLVIDVSSGAEGAQYPVSFLNAVPKGVWSDEYKTEKIVLRRIDGPNGVYYAGVFEVTKAQWDKVMGGTSVSMEATNASYNSIRGSAYYAFYHWPSTDEVAQTSFMGKLRQKTGLTTLDLPTEEEWVFAARAGVSTTWLCGDSETNLKNYAWYNANSEGKVHEVGALLPNAWGLYDVHGNIEEWCLNRWSDGQPYRVMLGGSSRYDASKNAFTYREGLLPECGSGFWGFRLFCRSVAD